MSDIVCNVIRGIVCKGLGLDIMLNGNHQLVEQEITGS